MNRKETTWFGLRLTQRQATNLFVLSIVGIFITFFIVIQMLMPLFSCSRVLITMEILVISSNL